MPRDTRHTMHVKRHISRVTCHPIHVKRHTPHVKMSHFTLDTSHITRHTPHDTRHTLSPVSRGMTQGKKTKCRPGALKPRGRYNTRASTFRGGRRGGGRGGLLGQQHVKKKTEQAHKHPLWRIHHHPKKLKQRTATGPRIHVSGHALRISNGSCTSTMCILL